MYPGLYCLTRFHFSFEVEVVQSGQKSTSDVTFTLFAIMLPRNRTAASVDPDDAIRATDDDAAASRL